MAVVNVVVCYVSGSRVAVLLLRILQLSLLSPEWWRCVGKPIVDASQQNEHCWDRIVHSGLCFLLMLPILSHRSGMSYCHDRPFCGAI